jgi:hypothetical protein
LSFPEFPPDELSDRLRDAGMLVDIYGVREYVVVSLCCFLGSIVVMVLILL